MKGEALKGHLDLVILAVLASGPQHGYAVIEDLRRRSGDVFDLPEGTVYPVLHRLAKAGLLRSEWNTTSGRRRCTYSLTPDGWAALGHRRSQWQEFSSAISSVLQGAQPCPSQT